MSWWFIIFIVKRSIEIILLFIFLHIIQLLTVGSTEIIVAGDSARLELPDGVQGGLHVVQDMLRTKDVATDMVRCCTDQLTLVCQPVGLDLGGISGGIRIFFTKHNMCRTKPSNLVQCSLSGISPEPHAFAKAEDTILTLVLSAQSSTKLGVSISTGQCQFGSSPTLQVLLEGVIVAGELSSVEVGVEEV